MENLHEIDILKYSLDQSVRKQYFLTFCNTYKDSNLKNIIDICNLRRDFATLSHNSQTFWQFQNKKNLIKINGSLRDKIGLIREKIRDLARKDLQVLSEIIGVKQIEYQDIVFLKENLKAIMLARDKKNIQLLTCFSLENVINGLLLLLKNEFGYEYKISTIVLDSETA